MARNRKPQWQPISALPIMTTAIDGMLDAAEAQHRNLQEAHQRPYSLADALVQRVLGVFTTQANDLWLYDEQLTRWQRAELSVGQRTEVERLTKQLARLHEVVQQILTVAEGLKSQTIECLLEKDDVEVALDFLAGKGKR